MPNFITPDNYTVFLTFFSLLISTFVCFISFRPVMKIGKMFNLVDKPDLRKINYLPKIRIGGFNIFLGFFAALVFNLFFLTQSDLNLQFGQINLLLIASVLVFISGLLDDIYNLSPYLRLAFQFVLAIFLCSRNLSIQYIDLSFFSENLAYIQLNGFLSLSLTCFWIVGIINAFNWIDGIDGLLTGVSIIFCLALSYINFTQGNIINLIVSISLLGSLIGFIFFNFKPAKIYMGDCGSNFLGFITSVLTLLSFSSINQKIVFSEIITINITNIFLGFLFLSYPLFDMMYVIFLRIYNKKSIFRPDRTHFHYRLIKAGLTDIQSTKIIYSMNLIIVSGVIFLSDLKNKFFILSISIILFLYFLITSLNKIKKS